MTITVDRIQETIAGFASRVQARTAWTVLDLPTDARSQARGDEPMPVGDLDSLVWFLALSDAHSRGAVDLSAPCTLEQRHRSDGNRGVIGCMSDGLQLTFGDFLAQTVITGDPAAFAVVSEAVSAQGASSDDVVDCYLRQNGYGGLHSRPQLSAPGASGVAIGSTTTNEQVDLLLHLVKRAARDSNEQGREAQRSLTILGSVLKAGGLGRGLPGYGPFRTKVAHVARAGEGNSATVRSDAAVFFENGSPQVIVSASVWEIPMWQGAMPGIALAEDFLMNVSRASWLHSTGKN